ncbi:MAG TPA: group II truncated hemoglobin [Rhizomicrobium sp.]|jgi:hemoglobin|nr:group II truncated hemoglobin [Rhizomicrobium sp.]
MSEAAAELVSPYDAMGGEAGVRALVDRFYDLMERDASYSELRAMHAEDLAPMRERLFQFFSGWFGGPRLYSNCVMSAHAPLAIGERENAQWLACMNRALEDTAVPDQIRALAEAAFLHMANGMRRR